MKTEINHLFFLPTWLFHNSKTKLLLKEQSYFHGNIVICIDSMKVCPPSWKHYYVTKALTGYALCHIWKSCSFNLLPPDTSKELSLILQSNAYSLLRKTRLVPGLQSSQTYIKQGQLQAGPEATGYLGEPQEFTQIYRYCK